MKNKVKITKGMVDILPDCADKHKLPPISYWHLLEQALRSLMQEYYYSEVRFPIMENTALFKRSLGEETDVVSKEMYTLTDSDEQVTLRPEGTAGCIRACIDAGLLRNQQLQRVWYLGPMFRREQPQYGRYRQFYQFGVEAFGSLGPKIDAEQIKMIANLYDALDVSSAVSLELNSLGGTQSRLKFREDLVNYFSKFKDKLDQDSKRRLVNNPLRILDSKNSELQDLIASAPSLISYLDDEDKKHFDKVLLELDLLGVNYKVNSHIVRGLDYYNRTVYEWVTDKIGAQSAICAGGRYDNLSEHLGGPQTPGVGFALGIERLLLLLQALDKQTKVELAGYLICVGEEAERKSLQIAETIRKSVPGFPLLTGYAGGSFKSQLKKADKNGAEIAFIFGKDEISESKVTIKFLREERKQQTISMVDLADFLGE